MATSRRRLAWILAVVVACCPSAVSRLAAVDATQTPSTTRTGTLVVAGDVKSQLTLTLADLRAMPRTTITMQEDAQTVHYEGVLVSEVIKRAGAPTGSDLRGNNLSGYVLAIANDGYQVLYSLGELDPGLTGSQIMIADSADGKPLFDYQGPFRIISPKDTRGARSVRMLERLDVVRLKK